MIPFYPEKLDTDIAALLPNISGNAVQALEEAMSVYLGVDHLVAFNSAASAMFAAQSCAGLGEGDEIIASPVAPVAQFSSAAALGAAIRYTDIKLDGTMDERFLEKALTPNSKAVLPFHFAGLPAAMEAICKSAKAKGVLVIEDATQALGNRLCSGADLSVLGFEGLLPGLAGECGFVATQSGAFAEKLRLFRAEGRVEKQFWNYDILSLGFSLQLGSITASLALETLQKMDEILEKRKTLTRIYDEHFKQGKLFYRPQCSGNTLAFYPIALIPSLYCPKEEIFAALVEKGIEVRVHYKPVYKTAFFKDENVRLNVAEDFYKAELSLPCHHQMTEDDTLYVAKTVETVLGKYSYRGCSF